MVAHLFFCLYSIPNSRKSLRNYISLNIELSHIVKPEARKPPVFCFVPAAAVNIYDAIAKPDGKGIVHIAGQIAGGCVTDDSYPILKTRWIPWLWPVPNPCLRILRWHTVNQVVLLPCYLYIQVVG